MPKYSFPNEKRCKPIEKQSSLSTVSKPTYPHVQKQDFSIAKTKNEQIRNNEIIKLKNSLKQTNNLNKNSISTSDLVCCSRNPNILDAKNVPNKNSKIDLSEAEKFKKELGNILKKTHQTEISQNKLCDINNRSNKL